MLPFAFTKVQNIVDALTKEQHKIAADGGTHDTTLLPMMTYQPVRITTADGKVIAGILKNEDSFSLQVLGKDDLNLYRFKRNNVKLTRLFVPPPPRLPRAAAEEAWGKVTVTVTGNCTKT